jgi:hypothetical protein
MIRQIRPSFFEVVSSSRMLTHDVADHDLGAGHIIERAARAVGLDDLVTSSSSFVTPSASALSRQPEQMAGDLGSETSIIHRYRFISEHHATRGLTRLRRVRAVPRRQGRHDWLAARLTVNRKLVERIRRERGIIGRRRRSLTTQDAALFNALTGRRRQSASILRARSGSPWKPWPPSNSNWLPPMAADLPPTPSSAVMNGCCARPWSAWSKAPSWVSTTTQGRRRCTCCAGGSAYHLMASRGRAGPVTC